MAHPGGRPQKDTTELPEGWQSYIISEMSEGATLREIKAYFGISNSLHNRWMEDEEEYSTTIKGGIQMAEAWWLKQGRINLKNKEFSPVLWYMNMKNRFGWKDRQDVTTNGKDLPTPILGGTTKVNPTDDISESNGQ